MLAFVLYPYHSLDMEFYMGILATFISTENE